MIAQAELITRDHIFPAHQRASRFLARARSARRYRHWRVAPAPAAMPIIAAALRIETTTNLTPNEIHRIGLERVAALSQELDVALRRDRHDRRHGRPAHGDR